MSQDANKIDLSHVDKLLDEQFERRIKEAKSVEDLLTIVALLERRKDLRKKSRISPDTMAIIASNLLGILLILGYERGHVITTKALGFVMRGRV